MSVVFLNFISTLFPFLIYFIYLIYSKTVDKREIEIFYSLACVSSIYLYIKFGTNDLLSSLWLSLPIILSIKKENIMSYVLISLFVPLYYYIYFNINIFISIILLLLVYILRKVTKLKCNNIMSIYYLIYLVVFYVVVKYHDLLSLTVFLFITRVFTTIIYYIHDKLANILHMHYSLSEITKEKMLYQSLFRITHEIKNPLAVCKGYLDMFDIKNEAKANKYINIIDQEIDRTLLLLKDFADISKLEIKKNIMDANMLIEDVCDESKILFDKKHIFSSQIDCEEIDIYADYNRLKQVLINIIKNARESLSDEGSVTLEAKSNKDYYVIKITDDGCGMNKDVKKNLGTVFYTTKKNGTGLGVFMCNEIINKHNGTIKYLSKEGKGTKVTIKLPLEKCLN